MENNLYIGKRDFYTVYLDIDLDIKGCFVFLIVCDFDVYGLTDEVITFNMFVDLYCSGYVLYPRKDGVTMVLKVVKKGDKTYYILSICIDKKWYDKFITEKIYNSLKEYLKVV